MGLMLLGAEAGEAVRCCQGLCAHYQSLSLSEASPKENKPCSLQSHVRGIFSLEELLLK